MRRRVGHHEGRPTRIDPFTAFELVVDTRAPGGIAIQTWSLRDRRRDQIGERRQLVERRRLVHQDLLHDRAASHVNPHVRAVTAPSLMTSALALATRTRLPLAA